jgi:hypothetical protein
MKYIVGMMNRGTNKAKESQTALAASLIISNNMTTAPAQKSLNDATIPLRVPSTLKDALQIMAEKEDRSLSSFIKRLLASHVEAQAAPAPVVVTYTSKAKAKPKAKSKAKK